MSEEFEKDILFQIDMQLYDEFNDMFCEINEHLGDVYTYNDLREIEEAESEKERKLLRNAITNLQNRIKELEEDLYSANKIVEEYIDSIPKQKIKDIVENNVSEES